jgi:hypothetical protein
MATEPILIIAATGTADERRVYEQPLKTESALKESRDWLYWWNDVTAICIPAPMPRWSRSPRGKLPSTSPGVRKTSFLSAG